VLSRLPAADALLQPSVIAAPLAAWSLRRHRRPGPAAQPGGMGTDDVSQLVTHRAERSETDT
jgi:hypothetical protein